MYRWMHKQYIFSWYTWTYTIVQFLLFIFGCQMHHLGVYLEKIESRPGFSLGLATWRWTLFEESCPACPEAQRFLDYLTSYSGLFQINGIQVLSIFSCLISFLTPFFFPYFKIKDTRKSEDPFWDSSLPKPRWRLAPKNIGWNVEFVKFANPLPATNSSQTNKRWRNWL